MGSYILNVVCVAFCVGLLEEILPAEYGAKAYVRLLTGLCLLLVMLSPVGKLLEALPDALDEYAAIEEEADGSYEDILRDSLGEVVQGEIAAAVKRDLASRFGVKNERTEVGVMLTEGKELAVERLVITLYGVDIFKDPYAIEEYFARLLSCECVVIVG
ncbi:MAG: hypothetical protein E7606_03760 [Ruminococcaceae bacterium]|nr:hypothetical protein [Oscillospiraceae bacterium]